MKSQRRQFTAEFKAKIAVEAIKGQRTTNEIASHYGVHLTQIAEWKKHALSRLPELFSKAPNRAEADLDAVTAPLFQQIGQLKVELDWVKKAPARSVEERRTWIDPTNRDVSVAR